jgi:hypothetical protein
LNGGTNRGLITIHSGAVLKILGIFLNDTTGVINGTGVLDVSGATFTNAGTISPGLSPGTLAIHGGLAATGSSVISLELAGAASNQQDHLVISGNVTLGGTLNLVLQNGYVPSASDTLTLLTCASWSGEFAQTTGGSLGGGLFLDYNLEPTGLSLYSCNSGTQFTPSASSLRDTVLHTESRLDTVTVSFCNTGWCPLQYSVNLSNLNPPSPTWLSVLAGDASRRLRRDHCQPVRLPADVSQFAAGSYTAQLNVTTNDPVHPTMQIPITVYVEPMPAVTNLVIRRQGTNMRLDWSTISGAAGYKIFRSNSWPVNPTPTNLIDSVGTNAYLDPIASANVRFYCVAAVR